MISTIVTEIAARYGLTKKGDKFVGKCPRCGGSETTDRFNIRLDGGYKCYSCEEFKGDIITWLREMDGKSCPEAHETAGITCRPGSSCAAWGTCRFGNGSGGGIARPTVNVFLPPPPVASRPLPKAKEGGPSPLWSIWANSVIADATKALATKKDVLTWLSRRGINAEAAGRYNLGWIRKDLKPTRADLGLEDKNGKKTLWIPTGLLIPTYDSAGNIHRLKVRRPGWTREKFLPKLKYVLIEGSGLEPMVLQPSSGTSRGAVTVEAELDAITCAAAHQDVLSVALGTVAGGLTTDLRQQLQSVPVILVALDAEQGKNGKPGPGPAAVKTWLHNYQQAKYWPVPDGKDPGDYASKPSADIHAWLEAGLPSALPSRQDPMISPDCTSSGGGGAQHQELPTTAGLEQNPEILELVSLLRKHSGWLLVNCRGYELKPWYPTELSLENRDDRARITALLYHGTTVPLLVAIMPPGRWDAAIIEKFVGIRK